MPNKEFEDFVESLPEELRNIPAVFYAPYGFKLVEIDGKKLWQPGTPDEWRAAMAKVHGVDPTTIKEHPAPFSCYNSSPTSCNNGPCGYRSYCGPTPLLPYVFCQCQPG